MATTTAPEKPENSEFERLLREKRSEYVPFGEDQSVTLTLGTVKKYCCRPTRNGALPTDVDLTKFIMLCKARGLNPWVGDAYLVGYDAKDGPEFSLITAIQALYKRAEVNPMYDGMESGVIVQSPSGSLDHIQGDFIPPGHTLVGGWARLFRKDQSRPTFETLNLGVYNKSRSQWLKDPGGMIVKCAEASVLRRAFPTQLGAMYIQDEVDRHRAAQEIAGMATPSKTQPTAKTVPLPSLPSVRTQAAPVQQQQQQPEVEEAEPEVQRESEQSADATEPYREPTEPATKTQPARQADPDGPPECSVDMVLGEFANAANVKSLETAFNHFRGSGAPFDFSAEDVARIDAAFDAKKTALAARKRTVPSGDQLFPKGAPDATQQ